MMLSATLALALIGAGVSGGYAENLEVQRIHAESVTAATIMQRMGTEEITPGCLTTPIPTTPSGPTWSFEINTFTSSSPEVVRGTFWRKPCAAANDAQLILTFTAVSGSPFVCAPNATIIQNSQQSGTIFFDTSPNSTSIDSFCGDLFVPTSVVIDERDNAFNFDDDAAFTFIYEGSSSVPDAVVNVGAYDPAAYGQSGTAQTVTGKLSGSYYDSARNGEGVLVEVGRIGTRRTLFITWYTYAAGAQRWVVGNVDYPSGATQVTVPLLVTTGGQFGSAFNPSQVQVSIFGSATVSFPTCSTMRFQWTQTGGQNGVYNYQRLVEGLEGITCP